MADDGWQRCLGEWTPRDRAMAHALCQVGERHRLVLWWAPFVVHRDAALAAAHPDWVLRHRDGRPRVVLARRKPWEAWALDLSHPDVRGWLERTAVRLGELGAQWLKCDFLYASEWTAEAAREGTCADPSVTGEEAHLAGLEAVRAGGVPLIGCGAPLVDSAGLVDLMRVGPDIGRRLRAPVPAALEPDHTGGCLANAWTAARRRAWLDGVLWRNDPDSVFLAAGPAHDAWRRWVAGHGLPLVLADPPADLGPAEVRRWAAALDRRAAATGAAVRPAPAAVA